jgi:hypothetical protein
MTATRRTTKVSVNLVIEVDPDSWDLAYGTGTKVADIRDDVREYVLNAMLSTAPVDEGGIVDVTLKGR